MSGVFVKIKFVEVIKERVGLYEYERSGHVMESNYMRVKHTIRKPVSVQSGACGYV